MNDRILEGLELMFVISTINELEDLEHPKAKAVVAELHRIADVAATRSDVDISRQEIIDYLSAKYV